MLLQTLNKERNEDLFDFKTSTLTNNLTVDEVAFFKKHGWVGKFPLLSQFGVEKASALHYESAGHFKMAGKSRFSFLFKPWFKSMHISINEYRNIASHPFIVEKVVSLLGENIIAWGCNTSQRSPGQKHRWHVDIEHKHWKGVSVFLGLKGISNLSTLNIITGSHLLDTTAQSFKINNDDEALKFCRQANESCELLNVAVNEGEFFIFDGPLWHGSENKSDVERLSLIIQYSTPDYKIKIPRNFNEPVIWNHSRPPVILVKGVDNHRLNRLK